jgi:uncharacterized protein with PQ loop repeat
MPTPLHHIHKRKRINEKHEQYPHPHDFKRFMDRAVYVVGIIGPLMGSLQAYKIWHERTAAGISLPTFSFAIFNDVVWFIYGAIHKEKPIMVMYTLWFVINILIVIGTLLYN